ncbi:MAG: 50S ribosomal protein L17 [Bacteroidales bacterium]|nr:50S ribosomal protein L17 [Bacteroidales bacterium]
MRHNNANNNLGRKSAHRKAMLSNMASSLILHKRIKTTTAKAKVLRGFIEPILTKSKEDSTSSRRLAFSYLQDKDAVTALFREVSPKITDRPGGYTRILKIGTRAGDAADMCYIELVDFNEAMLGAATAAESKTARRSRRGSKKKGEAGSAEAEADTGTEKQAKPRKTASKAAPKAEKAEKEADQESADSENKE